MSGADNPIDAAAAAWAVRLEAGPIDAEDQVRLDIWLAADARHCGALARARAGLLAIDRLTALAGPASACTVADTLEERRVARSYPWRADRRALVAASILVFFVGAVSWFAVGDRAERYESGLGEQRHVALVDGSQLQLDSQTIATVHFNPTVREVRLDQGEAMFRVAKDATRPFIVHAGRIEVRAVGTAFAVRTGAGETEVSVTEGVVEVWREGGTQAVRRVHALERALAEDAAGVTVTEVAPAAMQRDLAWQDGVLSFDGQPLSDAVAQINRRSRVKLKVSDPRLAGQPVVGIFQATDAVGFANAASAALGVKIRRDGDTILLDPDSSAR